MGTKFQYIFNNGYFPNNCELFKVYGHTVLYPLPSYPPLRNRTLTLESTVETRELETVTNVVGTVYQYYMAGGL